MSILQSWAHLAESEISLVEGLHEVYNHTFSHLDNPNVVDNLVSLMDMATASINRIEAIHTMYRPLLAVNTKPVPSTLNVRATIQVLVHAQSLLRAMQHTVASSLGEVLRTTGESRL